MRKLQKRKVQTETYNLIHSVQNDLRYCRYDKSKPLQPLASPHSRHYLIQALMTFDYALMHLIKRDFAKCMLLLGK